MVPVSAMGIWILDTATRQKQISRNASGTAQATFWNMDCSVTGMCRNICAIMICICHWINQKQIQDKAKVRTAANNVHERLWGWPMGYHGNSLLEQRPWCFLEQCCPDLRKTSCTCLQESQRANRNAGYGNVRDHQRSIRKKEDRTPYQGKERRCRRKKTAAENIWDRQTQQ